MPRGLKLPGFLNPGGANPGSLQELQGCIITTLVENVRGAEFDRTAVAASQTVIVTIPAPQIVTLVIRRAGDVVAAVHRRTAGLRTVNTRRPATQSERSKHGVGHDKIIRRHQVAG